MGISKPISIFIVLLLVTISPAVLAELEEQESNFQNQESITGHSTLIFLGSLTSDSHINASWELNISIREDYGTDLLPNQSSGLRVQIDNHLGNSDGNISSSEISTFTQLIIDARSWIDSEVAGCCLFDYSQLSPKAPISVTVFPPSVGPVYLEDVGIWGWSESVELVAISDLRTTRLLDLPRTGSLIEEIPLVVSLEDPWEFRYSAMQEIISGDPGNFTIERSESPVYSTIRIAIGNNAPPSLAVTRSGGTSISVPLDSPINFYAECEDSALETPEFEWEISSNGTILNSSVGEFVSQSVVVNSLIPSEQGYSSGDVLSAVMTCTDSFQSSSSWYDNVIIDGENPSYDIRFTEIMSDGTQIEHNESEDTLSIRSDSELFVDVLASDSSNLPVSIQVASNKSQGWRHFSNDELHFSDSFAQGAQVNGMHLSIDERHQAKQNTQWGLLLNVSDEAGNSIKQTWDILVKDSAGPVVIPSLISNSNPVTPSNPPRFGDSLTLILTESFDDLDGIDNTSWTVAVDGNEVFTNLSWSAAEKIEIPPQEIGYHVMAIRAQDSHGNIGVLSFQFSVEPQIGFSLDVIGTLVSGDQKLGNIINFGVTIQNTQSSVGSARTCHEEICSDYVVIPGATSSAPGTFVSNLEIALEEVGPLDIRLEWIGIEDGESGTIDFPEAVMVVNQDTQSLSPQNKSFLAVLSILTLLILLANRLWGIESMRP